MHFERRLLSFTRVVRGRIAAAVGVGLVSVGIGVARLALLGWLIGEVFAGRGLGDLAEPILGIAELMVLRGIAEHLRSMMAHETAARVQKTLRRTIYDKIAALGPGTIAQAHTKDEHIAIADLEKGVEFFGKFLTKL